MKLFDDLRKNALEVWIKLEKKCPVCGYDLDIVPELLSKHFPSLKCEQCHFMIELNTRNNQRITMIIFLVLPVAFALGIFFKTFF